MKPSDATAVSLAQLLEGATREDLMHLLIQLAERDPDLIGQIALLRAAAPSAHPPRALPAIDTGAITQQIRGAFRQARRRYDWGDTSLSDLLDRLTRQAQEYAETGDTTTALAILEATADGFLEDEGWTEFDHEGDFSFGELGQAFALALLDPDLPADVRKGYLPRLDAWQRSLDDYGGGELDPGRWAAQAGWDDPGLQVALTGGVAEQAPSQEERFLARYRVEILQRRGRSDEALCVALWALMDREACLLLIEKGRFDEALAHGRARLASADDCLAVVQALHAAGPRAAALALAEVGLDRPDPDEDDWVQDDDDAEEDRAARPDFDPEVFDRRYRAGESSRYPLAIWLRDAAAAEGQRDLAVRAGEFAVTAQPSLADWKRLEEVVGPEDWQERHARLLETLAGSASYLSLTGRIDILLAEERALDAWRLVQGYYRRELVARVADAVVTLVPEEVAALGRRSAEEIMNAGSSGRYIEARDWLRRVQTAMRHEGQGAAWDEYLDEVMRRHSRKYTLMPLLRGL